MQRKINTNITIDSDIYTELSEQSGDFGGSFSKTANHYMKKGLDLDFKKDLAAALEADRKK